MNFLTKILRKINFNRSTDVFFIGHPKAGNTWTRFQVGRYIQLICDYEEMPLFSEGDWLGRNKRFCVDTSIRFTHYPLTWENQTKEELVEENVIDPFSSKKVILISRYPLDVSVSHFHHMKTRSSIGFRGDLEDFLESDVFGIEKLLRFYNIWEEHYDSVDSFFLLRYEDMQAAPCDVLRRLLSFLKIDLNDQYIQEAVDFASFDNMKQLERDDESLSYKATGDHVFGSGNTKNPNARHVRKGKVGGYRSFPEFHDFGRYEELIKENLGTTYGYSKARIPDPCNILSGKK